MTDSGNEQFEAEQFYQDWAKTYPGLAGPFASPGWIPDLVQAAYTRGAADARAQLDLIKRVLLQHLNDEDYEMSLAGLYAKLTNDDPIRARQEQP